MPLDEIAQDTIHHAQRGVKHKQIVDNIYEIKAKALQYAICNVHTAGIVRFDFRAVFLSIARSYIFWVLAAMGLPEFHITALIQLYNNCACHIGLNGHTFMMFHTFASVKQGCPASMALF